MTLNEFLSKAGDLFRPKEPPVADAELEKLKADLETANEVSAALSAEIEKYKLVAGENEKLKADVAVKDALVADLQTQVSLLKSSLDEAKIQSQTVIARSGIDPVTVTTSPGGDSSIESQYLALKTFAERQKFFEAHKDQMNAVLKRH